MQNDQHCVAPRALSHALGQKCIKEVLPTQQVLSRRPNANATQLLQLWVTGLWSHIRFFCPEEGAMEGSGRGRGEKRR